MCLLAILKYRMLRYFYFRKGNIISKIVRFDNEENSNDYNQLKPSEKANVYLDGNGIRPIFIMDDWYSDCSSEDDDKQEDSNEGEESILENIKCPESKSFTKDIQINLIQTSKASDRIKMKKSMLIQGYPNFIDSRQPQV